MNEAIIEFVQQYVEHGGSSSSKGVRNCNLKSTNISTKLPEWVLKEVA